MTHPADLDEAQIMQLVDRLYDKFQSDPKLGVIFNPAIKNWAEHKQRMTRFWCSTVLRTGTYRGNPMGAHRPHALGVTHFEHWLQLWGETAREVLAADAAAVMVEYATRIGEGLRLGLGLPRARQARGPGIPVAG
jgi:hemoglobin